MKKVYLGFAIGFIFSASIAKAQDATLSPQVPMPSKEDVEAFSGTYTPDKCGLEYVGWTITTQWYEKEKAYQIHVEETVSKELINDYWLGLIMYTGDDAGKRRSTITMRNTFQKNALSSYKMMVPLTGGGFSSVNETYLLNPSANTLSYYYSPIEYPGKPAAGDFCKFIKN